MKQLKLNDFLDYNFLSDLQTSPDKKQMSFIKSNSNLEANTYSHQLFLSDGKDHHKVLDLKEDSRYVWLDQENILYFALSSDNDKELVKLKYTPVYNYNLNSKESTLAFQFKIPVSNIEVLNDNELLVTSNLSVDDHKLLDTETVRLEYLNKLSKKTFFHIIDEVPFLSNGSGFIDNKRSQAFIYNIKDQTYKPLVDKDYNFSQFTLTEDKSKIYFTSNKATGIPNFFYDINVYDVKTKDSTNLYDKNDMNVSSLIPINNKLYILGSNKKTHGINENPNFYKLDNNSLKKVVDFSKSASNSIGADVRFGNYTSSRIIDNNFYFIGTLNDTSCIYKFDGKTVNEYFKPIGSIDTFVQYNNAFYIIGLFNNHIQELYTADLKDSKVNMKSNFNTDILKDKYVASPIKHQFENDNQKLDGWVLLPENYDKNKTYPAILDIHGGPKTIYSDVFYHEMQVWVNLGYIVFFTNPRGGDAYGDDFANIRGKYGTIDYQDIMAFCDLVVSEYSIDIDRLGVTGGSYGGFMTNWIVSHTNRFKAAATQRSISNWVSFYGTSDIGSYFGPDQTDGMPIDDHSKVWEQSPLKHANNIKTPLLFIHADQDHRCPIEQASQLYTTIKMNGVDTRFVWFKDENHDLSRSGKPQARLKRLEEITDWFKKYLK